MAEIFEKEKNEGLELLGILFRNVRLIIIFVFCSATLSLVIAFFTPRKYQSTAVVFPTENNSIDDVIRNPQFGYDVEADRLIQVMQSSNVRDSIIKRYDLATYYKIRKVKPDWYDKLKKYYEKDIVFTRTPFMSVVIRVRSKDPVMSASIANSIISLISPTREKLLKHNLIIALEALTREYYSLKSDLDSLNTLVNSLTRNKENLNQFIQTERYISLVYNKNELQDNESATALQQLINQYNVKIGWFYDVQNKMKNTRLMIERPLPSVYVVENAIPSYKKVYPRYRVTLVISTVVSFLFISLFLILLHKIRSILTYLRQ